MIHSPCVAKCGLNDEDICMGCYRTIDEIVAWGTGDDGFKADVWVKLAKRKAEQAKGELGESNSISRKKWQEAEARIALNSTE
ncbi:DUF1289 domain-containing protein [Shewanella violacea]|uniref:Fe-S protein n=1 Tax=Shewanella violacea (strain JCM 10179 / CIP 106290 / LMG 19151 / DSS12) TaxID=637905 RepID=D4ZAH4_SHEVD|nr:DUF1289 domain-containing protein [Shewanella violacea]BAJ03019.1 conserved hypothetical protein [Shewanella violacea DSS12]